MFSRRGLVFVGRRAGSRGPFQWQMPQGGVDKGEDPKTAALRELEEETGVPAKLVEPLEEIDDWLFYDFPNDLRARMNGPHDGQRQKWFAFRFVGVESDIALDAHTPEFDAWRWETLDETPGLVIPFKRPVYEIVATRFKPWAEPA